MSSVIEMYDDFSVRKIFLKTLEESESVRIGKDDEIMREVKKISRKSVVKISQQRGMIELIAEGVEEMLYTMEGNLQWNLTGNFPSSTST